MSHMHHAEQVFMLQHQNLRPQYENAPFRHNELHLTHLQSQQQWNILFMYTYHATGTTCYVCSWYIR